jgi:hypothetical protein
MEETTDEVVKASGYPLSVLHFRLFFPTIFIALMPHMQIVIVGLGSAHNDELRALDADVAPLVSRRYGSMKRGRVYIIII